MSQLPNKPAPTKPANHTQGGGTIPHSQFSDPRMTGKAQDIPYSCFIAAGWTEAEMRAAGYLT